jgi:hypothetical protein
LDVGNNDGFASARNKESRQTDSQTDKETERGRHTDMHTYIQTQPQRKTYKWRTQPELVNARIATTVILFVIHLFFASL